MKCYALATRFDKEPITWAIPSSVFSFFSEPTKNLQQKIIEKCESIKPGQEFYWQTGSYHLYIKNISGNYCMVATDRELNPQQMIHLSIFLLQLKIDIQQVAKNIGQYTQDLSDPKLEKIKQDLEETQLTMLQNFDKLLKRGEDISDLAKKTEQLQFLSQRFKQDAEELNSCWPKCSIL